MVFGIAIASIVATRFYYWVTWDPIGEAQDDGWGRMPLATFSDSVDDIASSPNSEDSVASVRRVSSGLLSLDFVEYFIFVHRSAEPNTRENLVLRYVATDAGENDPPKVDWAGPSSLEISVAKDEIFVVTKQRSSIGGIDLKYDLATPVHAPQLEFWQRPLF